MRHHPRTSEQHPRSAPAIEPITMRIPDACHYMGIGRSTLYILIGAGQVEIVKIGRSTLVVTDSLRRLVNEKRPGPKARALP